jgi:AcrR family transcriptional regulator
MSTRYELTGRTNQKARTRAAMLQASREFLAEGVTPTVERAADRAGVSRSTAYRYFPNQRALLVAAYPEIDQPSLLGPEPPSDPLARLEIVTERLTRQVIDHEPELRAMLRLSLASPAPQPGDLPLRKGRAIGWIQDALAPLHGRLSEGELRRLAISIRAAVGIEPLVWLTDVAGLDRDDAAELMRATARTLLRSALAENGQPSG